MRDMSERIIKKNGHNIIFYSKISVFGHLAFMKLEKESMKSSPGFSRDSSSPNATLKKILCGWSDYLGLTTYKPPLYILYIRNDFRIHSRHIADGVSCASVLRSIVHSRHIPVTKFFLNRCNIIVDFKIVVVDRK